MRTLPGVLVLTLLSQYALSVKFATNKLYTPFATRVIEAELNDTVVCLRDVFETGLPEYGIPPLVSVDIPELTLNIGDLLDDTSSGFITASGLVNGLTTFYSPAITTSLSLSPLGFVIDLTLVFSQLYLDLDYDMDMSIDGMKIYGNGKIIINWNDVALRFQLFLGLADPVYITDLAVYLTIGDSKVTITGWFNDDEQSVAVTDLVNDYFIPHWINAQTEEISEIISPLLEELVGSLLAGGEDGRSDLAAILEAIGAHCKVDIVRK